MPGPDAPRLPGLPRLAQAIDGAGLEQRDVAAELGLSDTTLSRYLAGTRRPPEGFEERATALVQRMAYERRVAIEAADEALRKARAEGGTS